MKRVIIYGGTSLLSIEYIQKFYNEVDEFIVICRDQEKFKQKILHNEENLKNKINLNQIDLLDLNKNISFLNSLNDQSIDGIFFVMGQTGNPDEEIKSIDKCKENYQINLIHPVLIINSILPKLKKDSYICVFTSLAGIRGRALRMFYCSAKAGLISYLSGLRQKLVKDNIAVINVIAGYMDTEKFNYDVNKYLVSTPKDVIERVHKGIINKKENVYSSFTWFVISIIIKLIPEKIFKKLKF